MKHALWKGNPLLPMHPPQSRQLPLPACRTLGGSTTAPRHPPSVPRLWPAGGGLGRQRQGCRPHGAQRHGPRAWGPSVLRKRGSFRSICFLLEQSHGAVRIDAASSTGWGRCFPGPSVGSLPRGLGATGLQTRPCYLLAARLPGSAVRGQPHGGALPTDAGPPRPPAPVAVAAATVTSDAAMGKRGPRVRGAAPSPRPEFGTRAAGGGPRGSRVLVCVTKTTDKQRFSPTLRVRVPGCSVADAATPPAAGSPTLSPAGAEPARLQGKPPDEDGGAGGRDSGVL